MVKSLQINTPLYTLNAVKSISVEKKQLLDEKEKV